MLSIVALSLCLVVGQKDVMETAIYVSHDRFENQTRVSLEYELDKDTHYSVTIVADFEDLVTARSYASFTTKTKEASEPAVGKTGTIVFLAGKNRIRCKDNHVIETTKDGVRTETIMGKLTKDDIATLSKADQVECRAGDKEALFPKEFRMGLYVLDRITSHELAVAKKLLEAGKTIDGVTILSAKEAFDIAK